MLEFCIFCKWVMPPGDEVLFELLADVVTTLHWEYFWRDPFLLMMHSKVTATMRRANTAAPPRMMPRRDSSIDPGWFLPSLPPRLRDSSADGCLRLELRFSSNSSSSSSKFQQAITLKLKQQNNPSARRGNIYEMTLFNISLTASR